MAHIKTLSKAGLPRSAQTYVEWKLLLEYTVGAAVALVFYAVFRPRTSYVFLGIHGLLLLMMVPFGYHLVPQNASLRTLTGQLFAVGLVGYLWLLPASFSIAWGSLRSTHWPAIWCSSASLI